MIFNGIDHRDHIVLIDGKAPRKRQSGAVLVGQLKVVAWREFVALDHLPRRIWTRCRLLRALPAQPAELREIRMLRGDRRQQYDLGTAWIGRLAIFAKFQIVETPPGKVDRAFQ